MFFANYFRKLSTKGSFGFWCRKLPQIYLSIQFSKSLQYLPTSSRPPIQNQQIHTHQILPLPCLLRPLEDFAWIWRYDICTYYTVRIGLRDNLPTILQSFLSSRTSILQSEYKIRPPFPISHELKFPASSFFQ